MTQRYFTTLSIIVVAILFSACSNKYVQIFETGSNNMVNQDSTWIFENDTVKISYHLWSEKGVLTFTVFNKLDKPLYINWKKSAFIYNGNKLNYWDDIEKTSFRSNSLHYYWGPAKNNIANTTTAGNAQTTKAEAITFIPPKSNYTRAQFYILPISYFKFQDLPFKRYTIPDPNNSKNKYVIYQLDYEQNNTPVSFRNYLSFTTDENSDKLFVADNHFYISRILEMKYKCSMGKSKISDKGFQEYQYPYIKNTSFYIQILSDMSMEIRTYYNTYN